MLESDAGFLVRDTVVFTCEIIDCYPWFEFSDLEVRLNAGILSKYCDNWSLFMIFFIIEEWAQTNFTDVAISNIVTCLVAVKSILMCLSPIINIDPCNKTIGYHIR